MAEQIEKNEVLERLPKHLLDLVIPQPYNEYTWRDQAVWRYVMRQNLNFLGKYAHESYKKGLQKTGISIDSIPHMYGMNRILKEIGWAAVSVDGFIPPQAFMEFQAYNVLVIAADIRNIKHIQYTPAPDIIHEAAGHAPIIADEEYSKYLKLFGEIGAKAFSSAKDYELYEAIRHLSIVKEYPSTPKEKIEAAEKKIEWLQENMGEPSEMALIRNLHWWTVEYGLIGTLDDYRIYGAGLLSSIGESVNCMKDKVKKLPYSIEAASFSFDITTEQPQLFVTPTFQHLTDVLLEFAESMALKKGGVFGLEKHKESGNLGTVVLSSGLQISGVLDSYKEENGEPVFIKFSSPTALAENDKQIDGHGKDYHADGFSSPVGVLESGEELELMDRDKLTSIGVKENERSSLTFASGIVVEGVVKNLRFSQEGKLQLISLEDCISKLGEEILFAPEWGTFDMAVGTKVTSVFSGVADANSYGLKFEAPKEKTQKIVYSEEERKLFDLYKEIRDIRESNSWSVDRLKEIFSHIKEKYPQNWLLPMEILEMVHGKGDEQFAYELTAYLNRMKDSSESYSTLIRDGFHLVEQKFELINE